MLYWGLIVEMSVSVLFQTASAVPLCAVSLPPRESCRLVCSNQLTNVRRNLQESKPRFISSDPWHTLAHISAIEFRKLIILGCRACDFRLSLLWSNCTCHGAICSPCRVYVQFLG